jgi:hypothetical protein
MLRNKREGSTVVWPTLVLQQLLLHVQAWARRRQVTRRFVSRGTSRHVRACQVSSCGVTIGFAAFGHHFMPIGFKAATSSAALYLPTFSIFFLVNALTKKKIVHVKEW